MRKTLFVLMTRMFARFITGIALAAGLSAMAGGSLDARQKDTTSATATIAGKWTMSVESPRHGVLSLGLVLEQEGQRVTGTLANPHGEKDLPLEGEFVDGTLTLSTNNDASDPMHFTGTAQLKDDGTLAGSLSSSDGDLTWTAARIKE
jgi:hypothetical protein